MNQDFWKGYKAEKYDKADASTGPSAFLLIKQAGLNDYSGTEELVIADLGCGNGVAGIVLWNALGEEGRKKVKSFTSADLNPGMVEVAKKRPEDIGWGDKLTTTQSDSLDNKLPSNHYTHILMNHVIMMLPDHKKALKESVRILQPGGTLAFTTWKDLGWLHVLNQAHATVGTNLSFPSTAPAFFEKMGSKLDWYDPEWIKTTLKGEEELDTASIQITVEKTPIVGITGKEWAESLFGFLGGIYPLVWGKEVAEAFEKEGKQELVHKEVIRICEEKWAANDNVDMTPIMITAKKVA